jgi:succinyl-diaminopimelate desuccinylase
LELTAFGTAAHAARPWLGESAFDQLIEDYLVIKDMFPQADDDHWRKTMVLSTCSMGDGSINKVPDKAIAFLDIRYTDEDDPHELATAIERAVKSRVRIKALEPIYWGGESPYLDLLLAHTPHAEVGFEHGASDARFLSGHGIPSVVWGGEGEESQHSSAERLVLSSVEPLYKSLDGFLQTVQTMEEAL